MPNPNPRFLALKLSERAEAMELRVYTRAMQCVISELLGPQPAGWSRMAVPDAVTKLWGGAYYFRVRAKGSSAWSEERTGKLVVLR